MGEVRQKPTEGKTGRTVNILSSEISRKELEKHCIEYDGQIATFSNTADMDSGGKKRRACFMSIMIYGALEIEPMRDLIVAKKNEIFGHPESESKIVQEMHFEIVTQKGVSVLYYHHPQDKPNQLPEGSSIETYKALRGTAKNGTTLIKLATGFSPEDGDVEKFKKYGEMVLKDIIAAIKNKVKTDPWPFRRAS